MSFLEFGPTNFPIPIGAIWVDIGEKQLIKRLTAWENDEEIQLTKWKFCAQPKC